MSKYAGKLEVEGADWSLRAEQMAMEDNEIHFDFVYHYNRKPYNEYPFNGVAMLRQEGYYESTPKESPEGKRDVIIYILKVRLSDRDFFVEGFWYESGEGAWRISGTLESLS